MYIIMSTYYPYTMKEGNEKEEKVTGDEIEKETLKPTLNGVVFRTTFRDA
jgi:hypothetical protein